MKKDQMIIDKYKEILEKKSSCIYHLIKIILRNADKLSLRKWESNFIHNYAEMYSKLESELAALESSEEPEQNITQADNKMTTNEWMEAMEVLRKHIGKHVVWMIDGKTVLLDTFNSRMIIEAMHEFAELRQGKAKPTHPECGPCKHQNSESCSGNN